LLAAINQALEQFIRDGTLERIYRRHGLWDDRQAALAAYQPEAVVQRKSISTLREWPKYLPLLLRGALTTVALSVLGMAVAVVTGLVVVLARLYGPPLMRWLAQAYVEVVRGTPLLIQLFMIYYGLPQIGLRLNAFLAGILGLGLNYAANEAENYRAGIQSIPKGQTEAAQALGMTQAQILRRIVELTKVYGELATSTYDYIGLGLMTAGIYFALSYPASIFASRLERRLAYDRR
jgi:polar amino acid transport system substrate-binding protein